MIEILKTIFFAMLLIFGIIVVGTLIVGFIHDMYFKKNEYKDKEN